MSWWRRRLVLTLIIILAWVGIRVVGTVAPRRVLAEGRPELPIAWGEKLLVVAPHPDDETLAAAGLMQRVLGEGGSVRVVVLTCGDGYSLAARNYFRRPEISPAGYLRFGHVRMEETRRAVSVLGLDPTCVTFLGFPDRGLASIWMTGRSTSRYTGVSVVPYRECYRPGAAYTRQELEEELGQIIASFRPTILAFPDPADGHPDHRAAYYLLQNVPERQLEPCRSRLLLYRVHPHTRSRVLEQYLGLPTGGERGDGVCILSLNGMERGAKRRALATYRTQTAVWSELFLRSFLSPTETFRLAGPSVPTGPPASAGPPVSTGPPASSGAALLGR
ncbi:MAG TPA: PIG-L family deacetylase [Firmicutes bacterium]|nr:PIG-L family deacetylase [Bacillota bacterium]